MEGVVSDGYSSAKRENGNKKFVKKIRGRAGIYQHGDFEFWSGKKRNRLVVVRKK